jgi:hypothetical protein
VLLENRLPVLIVLNVMADKHIWHEPSSFPATS